MPYSAGLTDRNGGRMKELEGAFGYVCVCVLMYKSATCHVAVYQLWSDGSAAIHIDEIVP